MTDLPAAKRAQMACRAYLKLYDAGPPGAPLTKDDLLGSRDDPAADFPVALAVLARFVDDTILDEPGHQGGVPHYALTAGMRSRLEERQDDGAALVEALRADLATVGRGEGRLDELVRQHEAMVRTGSREAGPI